MKFIVDECVGNAVTEWLIKNGYVTISVYDNLQGFPDKIVLEKAFADHRILITSDKDFGEMIFRHQMHHTGIILLRLIHEQPDKKIDILKEILEKHANELEHNFIVATESSIRITRL